jgi:exopolyphosphatase/guanosine-5'-triphosphate,3'-diphosphate pyrophosphatase
MQEGSLLAAVDMGSNSFRLEIDQLEGPQMVRVEYLKETVRLGGGLDFAGNLTEDAMGRALACLARFAERLRGFAATHMRAVATQTLREARNRDTFLERAQKVLGFPIEVISGREEARLIYSGVSGLLPINNETRLVVDIGGRSTEMIVGHGKTPLEAESFKVGSVSHSMRFFADGKFTTRAFTAARIAAGAEIEESVEAYSRHAWKAVYGSSGTVGAIAELLQFNQVSNGAVTPEGLDWIRERLLRAGSIDKLKLDGIKEDRKAVLAGGLTILQAVFEQFSITRMEAARGALRHGVLFDLLGRETGDTDVRNATVRRLQQRFGGDQVQAKRVEEIALRLHQQLDPSAAPEARRELVWAAALHEIGMCVSHSDYHRHGAYLVSNADAAGFSQSQQARLAALVLAHRGGLRKVDEQLTQRDFRNQLIALRLATLLAHARRKVEPDALIATSAERGVALQARIAWANEHPQTMHLLNDEVDAWRKIDVRMQVRLVIA